MSMFSARIAVAVASAALLSGLVLGGCASADNARVYEKDGKQYGVTSGTFRNRWWNYYERAVSYSEGGFYAEAASDLSTAIDMRETDERRARTYGMHFVEYFPHRELGIAYLGLGRADDSIRELELSLAQEDSAKAKFYLNKARAERLKAAATGASGPAIKLSSPPPGVTRELDITLAGSVTGDSYVSAITVGGKAEYIELAGNEVSFSKTLPLVEGENVIAITASDLAGATAKMDVTVVADRRGPVIELADTDASTVGGIAFDPSGVTAVTVNGKPASITTGSETAFTSGVSLAAQSVEITATDAVGNTTTAVFTPGTVSNIGPIDFGLYSSLDNTVSASSAKSGPGPRIKLRELTDYQEVYYDSLFVDGQASAPDDIVSITLNGEELLTRKGKKMFFNFVAGLSDGENTLTLVARDAGGGESTKSFKVVRLPQSARSNATRLSVSAVPFAVAVDDFASEAAYDSFIDAMSAQGRFRMVERALIEDVLAEQSLSREEIADPATAARFGKVAAAECVIVGKLHETDNSVEVYARIVDTETAEILASHDVYGEDKSLTGLAELMDGLALKFRNGFPMAEGIVILADGKDITLDLGTKTGIGKNALVVLFTEGEPVIHPVTGKELGRPTKVLGKARLYDVYDDMSKAEVVFEEKGAVIAPLVKAITK